MSCPQSARAPPCTLKYLPKIFAQRPLARAALRELSAGPRMQHCARLSVPSAPWRGMYKRLELDG